MSSMGFEPTIPAGERPQTYALDLAATGIGKTGFCVLKINDFQFLVLGASAFAGTET